MAELKDCPFCGAEMTIIPIGPVAWRLDSAYDHHDDCILLGRTFDVVKTDAQREALENHWNTRADEARAELAEQEHVSAAEERDHLRVRLSDAQALAGEVERLRAEVAALTADAERYRWLRGKAGPELLYGREQYARTDVVCGLEGDDLDEAIDAALDASRALATQEAK